MRRLFCTTLTLVFFLNPALGAEGLPVCPSNWKVELIAEVPQLIHPSAVCVAPDGRVFVGQDPMDMGLASDKPADYILCFHPSGKVTVFATNLYAVFGLSYLDGKLYVHHCPKVTVFRDDGDTGREPVDLFQTNPRPWQGGFNDHIPANLHYAMDGYFYLATGDKGIHGAVGKDGSKAELEGGGIIRFRPDGTQLEVYSSGTRNHLDVAINDEMEMFTYDNTDDGNGWWTRVTHMVERGWYGYPHDYKPQRPYTLWMMKDYGGGSPTGAIAYNEDALPEEYHGNLFMSEWGKGELARFVVERSGGTYRIVSREVFLKLRGNEFRPVGVDVSADGMSLYVADWNYGGWKNKQLAGRFLKVTYLGATQASPKPGWYVQAALGKPIPNVSTDELIEGLKHSSERVRLTAQRMLAKRGAQSVARLRDVLSNAPFSARAQAHAIWALDAIDRGQKARGEITQALSVRDPMVRRQAARQLAAGRGPQVISALSASLKDDDRSVRFQAATALGKIGDPAAIPALLAALDDDDLFARYAAFTALHYIGVKNSDAWALIARGLESGATRIRENTLFAMRETWDKGNVQALANFVADRRFSAEARAATLGVLAGLHRMARPWNGNWWGTQPVKSPSPAKVIDWEGTSVIIASIQKALHDSEAVVRLAAIQGTQMVRDTNSLPALVAMFRAENEIGLRQAVIEAVGAMKIAASGAFIQSLLEDPAQPEPLVRAAISAAEKIGARELRPPILALALSEQEIEVRRAAIETLGNARATEAIAPLAGIAAKEQASLRSAAVTALGKIGDPMTVAALSNLLANADAPLRREVVAALGATKQKEALPPLLAAWRDDSTRAEAISALALRPDIRALDAYLDGITDKNSTLRDAGKKALQTLQRQALPELEQRARENKLSSSVLAALQRVYEKNNEAKFGPLFANTSVGRSTDPGVYANYAAKNRGDSKRGKVVFADLKGVACIKCHKAEGQGGDVGPDLNSVGAKYNRAQIVEHILYPSKIILDGYQQTTVFTKDGESQSGIARGETSDELTLVDTEGRKHVIAKKQIESRKQNELSLMPEGLQVGLSLQEFADLVAYVEGLKDQPIHASGK